VFEVEVKFRVTAPETWLKKLQDEFHITFGAPQMESDLFFINRSLGFPQKGNSLRIRRCENKLWITFKGPRLDTQTKTREELELPLGISESLVDMLPDQNPSEPVLPTGFLSVQNTSADGKNNAFLTVQKWVRLLHHLGFAPFATLEKKRQTATYHFNRRDFTITFDQLADLGTFTELETCVPGKEELDSARAAVMCLASQFGLEQTIPQSYLKLKLEKQGIYEKEY